MATVLANTGRALLINRLNGTGAAPIYLAQGTGTGTSAVTDTTLFTETGTRVSGISSVVTTTVTGDTFQVSGTITAASSISVTNAGTFDASTAGNLYLKADFTSVGLNSGDSISYVWKWQIL